MSRGLKGSTGKSWGTVQCKFRLVTVFDSGIRITLDECQCCCNCTKVLLNTVHKEQELNASVELSERFSQACEKQSSSGTVQIQKHIAAETEVALVI
jgi:hypothetical protein